MEYKEVISKEDFEDVVIFSVSEPGAMGPNDMTFYKKTGESFFVDYKMKKHHIPKLMSFFLYLQIVVGMVQLKQNDIMCKKL